MNKPQTQYLYNFIGGGWNSEFAQMEKVGLLSYVQWGGLSFL